MKTGGPSRKASRRAGGLLSMLLAGLPLCCGATDWPQYRGGNHDGISKDRIIKQWTGAVTNPVWRVSLTNALSSLTVSGGRVFTQGLRTIGGVSREACVALNAATGWELWAVPVDDGFYPNTGVGLDDGPRTTPVADGESVFVLSSYLRLYRLNATNGAIVWERDLQSLYGGSVIPWQNAASPLIEGGLIFLNLSVGTSTLLALRTSDGGLAWHDDGLAWRLHEEEMTHATPVPATIHGVRQVIFATQSGLVSVEPASGNLLWKSAYPFNYGTCIGVSPVVFEDMVFISGAQVYGMGSAAIRVSFSNDTWTTAQLWSNTGFTSTLSSHWMTPVCQDGFLYGQFGVQSFDGVNAQLKCVDLRTGAVKWSANGFGRGATLLVDGQLLVLTEKGDLVLAAAHTNAYTEVARCLAIPFWNTSTNKCWNSPAVCDGRVYVRSTGFVACFDFSVPALKLDAPQPLSADRLRLTIRTVNGAPVSSNRLAGMEVRAGTNLAETLSQWPILTNQLVLTNGTVLIDDVDSGTQPRRFFMVSESE
ncbi:MAG TPA: PQQ-binding-like beta-propeller repeat protein [Verrucomicrobiae bacterium]|nr:PQQ-binding-like beta-propeller repeat protein [Verrucomicrobiae bacterium]